MDPIKDSQWVFSIQKKDIDYKYKTDNQITIVETVI